MSTSPSSMSDPSVVLLTTIKCGRQRSTAGPVGISLTTNINLELYSVREET